MQSNDGKNHIEDAWNVCRTWFGRYGKESDQEIYLLFREVRPSRLRSGFKTLEREGTSYFTGVVWEIPGSYDADGTDVDTAVDHLEAGDFVSMTMNYQMEVGNVTLDMLTTVTEDDSGVLDGWTRHRGRLQR